MKSRTLVRLLSLAVLAVLMACSASDQPTGRLGESIVAGDYQLAVTSMENPAERPDRFTSPKPGNRFVKFEVTATNRGQKHLPVFASHFAMRDTGGIDNPVRTDLSGDRILKQTSLAPGQKTDGILYFEMAANQSPAELVFSPAVVGWRTRITVDLQSRGVADGGWGLAGLR